ncbi:M48 family metallopeptidase [Sphingomonas sp. GlSt437]|uniref:M48 family metallopeptidase n=1 Tax=Sphingomonas sp. GlSt437 TaxID=3389970 RepID=UPI003A84B521
MNPASGELRLTVPPRVSKAEALRWAEGQRGWMAAQQRRLPQARPFVEGAMVPLGDEEIVIDWRADAPRRVAREGNRLVVGGPRESVARRVSTWLKAEALRVLSDETGFYAARAGVPVSMVSVGDPRGRWGSCASDGAIRYSWRLILAPAWVRRATVAHEVAHRVHMNHGPAFHALVAELYGSDPTPARAWLKRHGAALHWFGRES